MAEPPVSAVARNLPALDLGARDLTAEELEYLAFYGLDFSAEFPKAVYSFGTIPSADDRLALQCWRQPGASSTLLLVHGYFDHVGLFSHLVRFGLARGSNVVAFDLPGHGLSSGARAHIDEFSRYRQAIVDVLAALDSVSGQWQVMAQSTGAAAVMDYLTTVKRHPFARIVLLAPLVRPRGWLRIKTTHALLQRFRESVPRDFAENSHDSAFLEFLPTDPLQPQVISVAWVGALRRWIPDFLRRQGSGDQILVIQGDEDSTVDWPYNLKQVTRLFPAAEVRMIAGGRHHLANESAQIRSNYLSHVERFLEAGLQRDSGGNATLKESPGR